jgi:hypothetical protein
MKRISLWMFSLFALVARPGLAVPCLQEVFYDATGADAASVFTEIFGTPGTTFEGWRLVGIDGGSGSSYRSIDLTGAVIPADGILLIATSRAIDEVLAARDFIAEVDWQNGPDVVELRDALGAIVDALQYGEAGGLLLGEGLPAPDPPAGLALTRTGPGADSGDNAADFVASEPTPGWIAGSASVSEPATAMIFVLGLGTLVIACRRPPSGSRAGGAASRAPRRPRSC